MMTFQDLIQKRVSICSRCEITFIRWNLTRLTFFFQGRLHWGQYITPSFTTLQYQPHDPDFYASIVSFKAVAEKFDPGHMMSNHFLNKVIWLVTDIWLKFFFGVTCYGGVSYGFFNGTREYLCWNQSRPRSSVSPILKSGLPTRLSAARPFCVIYYQCYRTS
jgi:hypothetical protein